MKNIQAGNPYEIICIDEQRGLLMYLEFHRGYVICAHHTLDGLAKAFIRLDGIGLVVENDWPCIDDALAALHRSERAKEIGWNAPQLLSI